MAGRIKKRKAPQEDPRATITGANGREQNHRGSQAGALLRGDDAIRLLTDIKAHRLDPTDLSPQQRRSCLLLVANGSQTSAELAVMLKTSPTTIRMDLKAIRETMGREVSEWTLTEVLGQLALSAEKCTAQAMKAEDPGLAWTVQRDFAKLLKEFGVIGPKEDRAGFRLTIESIGEGYERARQVLSRALDPRLTGEVIVEANADVVPALPLSPILSGAEGGAVVALDGQEDQVPQDSQDPTPPGIAERIQGST